MVAVDAFINADENIGKTVGRPRPAREAFDMAMRLQRSTNRLQAHLEGICPTGVFRFDSHEDADKWLLSWMTRRRPRKS